MILRVHNIQSSHLPNIEHLLRAYDGFRAEFTEWHQTLNAIIETNDAAEVFDADDVAVGQAARTSISEAEEQRQGAFNHGLLSRQVQLLVLCIH